MLYHFTPYLTRPNANLRHPLSRAPLALRPASGGLATPPFQSGVRPKKILPWIFLGIAEAKGFCMLLSRASMRLLLFGKKQLRSLSLPKKNPSVDFSWDCRIAAQFCMLLTRPPWLDTVWQKTITFPEPVEGNNPKKAFAFTAYIYSLLLYKGEIYLRIRILKIVTQKLLHWGRKCTYKLLPQTLQKQILKS